MKNFTFVAGLSALTALAALAQGQEATGPIDYNCQGQVNASYDHPSECSKFISCINGQAFEKDCAPCDLSNGVDRCPDGKLHYLKDTDRCEWANVANCTRGTSNGHTTSSPQTLDSIPVGESLVEKAFTSLPVFMEECDPNTCEHRGDCVKFFICNKDTKVWDLHYCGDDLFWNEDVNKNETNGLGGSCDFWDNLSQETQDRYNNNKECFPDCYYEQNIGDSCTGNYIFHPAHTDLRKVTKLSCPLGLIYNPKLESCDLPENVQGCDALKSATSTASSFMKL